MVGYENRKNRIKSNCMSGFINCDGRSCRACGWDITENRIRKEYIRKYGLTRNARGNLQLVMDPERREEIAKRLA